jgi:hypothetical protein
LAKKLAECGVFGVSSDEYLTYATKNREEWTLRGQEVVALLKENAEVKWQRWGNNMLNNTQGDSTRHF